MPELDIAGRLRAVAAQLPPDGRAELLAVSKFQPAEAIMEAYAAGQRMFGESRVQELQAKAAALPADIRWHFIGHLQTNKVRPAVAAASVIESIDSLRLLRAVEAESRKQECHPELLLEVHVAAEEAKSGFAPEELESPELLAEIAGLTHARLTGVMGMATNTSDPARIRADFRAIRAAAVRLRELTGLPLPVISMGMSGDFTLALEEGSTRVRVGSLIFGPRNY